VNAMQVSGEMILSVRMKMSATQKPTIAPGRVLASIRLEATPAHATWDIQATEWSVGTSTNAKRVYTPAILRCGP
jgi:hypothetical protein